MLTVRLSKTKIKKHLHMKNSPDLIATIIAANKEKAWLELSKIIAGPTANRATLNLKQIEAQAKSGEVIVVPGKVLGVGEVEKKIKICAISISSSAREKLKKSKIEFSTIAQEIKENPGAKGIRILR